MNWPKSVSKNGRFSWWGDGWRRWLGEIFPIPQPQPVKIPVRPGGSPPRRPPHRAEAVLMKTQITFGMAILLLLLLPLASTAAQLETRFGPILYDTNEQLIDYGRSLNPVFRLGLTVAKPSIDEVVARHEYIFETACDRLDINLNGMKTAVRIVTSLKELRAEYQRLVPDSVKIVNAFYSHRDKTIWYAQERLSRGLALHETAHAILDHYFIRPIPAGVDELVAEMVQRFSSIGGSEVASTFFTQ